MASFNGARFIHAQMSSILQQIGIGDELVISDDASTDATCEIIRAFGDPRVKLIHNSVRAGYVKNFERAIHASGGQYLFFADQDDVWLPEKVSAQLCALNRRRCVASDAVVVDEELNQIHPSFLNWRRAISFRAAALIIRPCVIGATMACDSGFARSLLPFPRGVPHDLWISVNAALQDELDVLDRALILYRRHSSVASTTVTGNQRALHVIARERLKLLAALCKQAFFN